MSAVSSDSIQQATEQVLASKDYHLKVEENSLQPFWERLLEMLFSVFGFIANLFSFLDGLPQFLRWVIIFALFAVLILLVGHILYSIFSALRPGKNHLAKSFNIPERRDDPRLWENEATELAGVGKYIEAARLLLRASLFRLENSLDRPFRRATTNREYLRKYRKLSILEEVKQLVETIDRKWYGEEPCDQNDYEQCRLSHRTISEAIQNRHSAHREST